MNKEAIFKQAMILRDEVGELDDTLHLLISGELSKEDIPQREAKADKLWQQHAELLKQVYAKPTTDHHIQATIRDTYRNEAIVLTTSFPSFPTYLKAKKQLGDYDLDSLQVGQCEECNDYYLTKDGIDMEGQGFCSTGCVETKEEDREYWEDLDAEERDRAYWEAYGEGFA